MHPLHDSSYAGLDVTSYRELWSKQDAYALKLFCCICTARELKHRLKTENDPVRLEIVRSLHTIRCRD